MAWLLRDGEVLATLEVADAAGDRIRGLLGRPKPEGAVLLRRPLLLHTIGVGFRVDAAFCDPEMRVTDIVRLGRFRIALPRPWRAGCVVVVAGEGAFERWRLAVGDRLEVKGT